MEQLRSNDERPNETEASYTYGHSSVVVNVHSQRTATSEAAFFLPHLRAGMRLLDVGCGPGSITVGLALAVAPGDVTGVDIEPGVLEQARALAAEQGVTNVRFEQGNVYQLPFADHAFDGVFAHTLLEHVADRGRALAEVRRVLKPGGVIGVRDAVWASGVFWPYDPHVERALSLYAQVWEGNGGHPNCGRQLRALLQEAGCRAVITSASFRWDGSLESSRSFGELLAQRFALTNFVNPILAHSWATADELHEIREACRSWAERPDIYAAMIMSEAVGWT